MRLILGIGNPGNKYIRNRHNIGFMMLDYFADKASLSFIPSKNDYYYTKGKINNSNFLLVKPTTYVNNSGFVANYLFEKYKLDISDFLVVIDDVNLQTGTLRLKRSGGDGGHNGMSSIIYHLQDDQFPRLKIGVGSNFEKGNMVNYVLGDFSDEEFTELKPSFEDGVFLLN